MQDVRESNRLLEPVTSFQACPVACKAAMHHAEVSHARQLSVVNRGPKRVVLRHFTKLCQSVYPWERVSEIPSNKETGAPKGLHYVGVLKDHIM